MNAVLTFTVENGSPQGTQTRDTAMPAVDGKPAGHTTLPFMASKSLLKDSVVEVKIRFDGNTMMDVEFDDRAFTGSHYGHLCRAQVYLDKVKILDERDGTQSNALIELKKDPAKNKDAINKIYATHMASFPAKVEAGKWYTLVVETVGEAMRVTLDGQPVAYFKSPGIGHPTKTRLEFGVSGKSGLFSDLKVWNAEPAK